MVISLSAIIRPNLQNKRQSRQPQAYLEFGDVVLDHGRYINAEILDIISLTSIC